MRNTCSEHFADADLFCFPIEGQQCHAEQPEAGDEYRDPGEETHHDTQSRFRNILLLQTLVEEVEFKSEDRVELPVNTFDLPHVLREVVEVGTDHHIVEPVIPELEHQ